MNKFKVVMKDSQVKVKYKLNKLELVNDNDMKIFNTRYIRGIMKPTMSSAKKIEYVSPGNITLYDFMKSGITKNDFFVILAQFVECIKKVERYGFNIDNLVMDTKYCFFNDMTREVQFIYQPIINLNEKQNIFIFLDGLLNQCVVANGQDASFVPAFASYLNSCEFFSPANMENYIIKTYPAVYKQIKRMKPGDSQFLKHTGWNYYEEKYNSNNYAVNNFNDTKENKTIDSIGLNDNTEADIVSHDFCNTEKDDTNVNREQKFEFDEDVETDVMLDDEDENTTVLMYDDDGTQLLAENDGTGMEQLPVFERPYLTRMNTFEQVDITKPLFKIGKGRNYVDYFVANNNAVSRMHADVITENSSYYIRDNNSTNHTFVNGTIITPNEKVQIFDGDSIMLGNEPFEFHIEK